MYRMFSALGCTDTEYQYIPQQRGSNEDKHSQLQQTSAECFAHVTASLGAMIYLKLKL